MNKIGIVRNHPAKGAQSRVEKLFGEYFGNQYEPRFFHWEDVSEGEVKKSREANGKPAGKIKLDELSVVQLNTLGPIREKMPSFLEFLTTMGNIPGRVINDPSTFKYNLDKGYLLHLQENGIPVIPTEDVSFLENRELPNVYGGKAVLKPRYFGERMNGVIRANELTSVKEAKDYRKKYGQSILAQKFIEGIVKTGERSLVFVGDTFSHAIWRRRTGWKSNPGSLWEKVDPTKRELQIAEKILGIWPTEYHITRFDFIGEGEQTLISEVEMGNPNVWIGSGKKEKINKLFFPLLIDYIQRLVTK